VELRNVEKEARGKSGPLLFLQSLIIPESDVYMWPGILIISEVIYTRSKRRLPCFGLV
jgi:hypothetical protein